MILSELRKWGIRLQNAVSWMTAPSINDFCARSSEASQECYRFM